ncbi:hypothetical protein MRX96_006909 [Rhipicephalus microplus]
MEAYLAYHPDLGDPQLLGENDFETWNAPETLAHLCRHHWEIRSYQLLVRHLEWRLQLCLFLRPPMRLIMSTRLNHKKVHLFLLGSPTKLFQTRAVP